MDGGGELLNLELNYQNNKSHLKHPEPDSFFAWGCSYEIDIFLTSVFKIYLFKSFTIMKFCFQKDELLPPQ